MLESEDQYKLNNLRHRRWCHRRSDRCVFCIDVYRTWQHISSYHVKWNGLSRLQAACVWSLSIYLRYLLMLTTENIQILTTIIWCHCESSYVSHRLFCDTIGHIWDFILFIPFENSDQPSVTGTASATWVPMLPLLSSLSGAALHSSCSVDCAIQNSNGCSTPLPGHQGSEDSVIPWGRSLSPPQCGVSSSLSDYW